MQFKIRYRATTFSVTTEYQANTKPLHLSVLDYCLTLWKSPLWSRSNIVTWHWSYHNSMFSLRQTSLAVENHAQSLLDNKTCWIFQKTFVQGQFNPPPKKERPQDSMTLPPTFWQREKPCPFTAIHQLCQSSKAVLCLSPSRLLDQIWYFT